MVMQQFAKLWASVLWVRIPHLPPYSTGEHGLLSSSHKAVGMGSNPIRTTKSFLLKAHLFFLDFTPYSMI